MAWTDSVARELPSPDLRPDPSVMLQQRRSWLTVYRDFHIWNLIGRARSFERYGLICSGTTEYRFMLNQSILNSHCNGPISNVKRQAGQCNTSHSRKTLIYVYFIAKANHTAKANASTPAASTVEVLN